jgi:hypothetical protein
MATVSSETDTSSMPLTSMPIRVVDERLAKQCPPLRSATFTPSCRASASAPAMSSGTRQRTTARGRTLSKRAICDLRADSYAAEPATSTSAPTVIS